MDLEAKVALVTGAGAGIGRAVALRLAREGAAVVVADVDEETGIGTVGEIRSRGGRAAFVLADVASTDVSGMVAFAEEEFGGRGGGGGGGGVARTSGAAKRGGGLAACHP